MGTEEALVVWDKDLTAYVAAGAKMPDDEDLVHSMLKMLPPILSREMLAKAHAESTPSDLREWIRLHAEFERKNPTRKAANLVEHGGAEAAEHNGVKPQARGERPGSKCKAQSQAKRELRVDTWDWTGSATTSQLRAGTPHEPVRHAPARCRGDGGG